jgi:hypothetical protein
MKIAQSAFIGAFCPGGTYWDARLVPHLQNSLRENGFFKVNGHKNNTHNGNF